MPVVLLTGFLVCAEVCFVLCVRALAFLLASVRLSAVRGLDFECSCFGFSVCQRY